MAATLTVVASGPTATDKAFGVALGQALGSEAPELEGATRGGVLVDMATWLVYNADSIIVGIGLTEAAVRLSEKLLDFARHLRGTVTVRVVGRGQEVVVEDARRDEVVELVQGILSRGAAQP